MSDSLYALALACLIGVLSASGALKLASPTTTRAGFETLAMPQVLRTPIFIIGVPLLEVALAVSLLLVPAPASIVVGGTCVALFAVFFAVVLRALAKGVSGPCNCFGRLDRTPLSAATVVRNAALLILSVMVALGSARGPLLAIIPGLGSQLPVFQAGLFILGALAAFIGMSTLKPAPGIASPARPDSKISRHLLHDLFGTAVDARTWHGEERSLLLFVSTSCAACHALADSILEVIPAFEASGTRLRIITDVEAGRAISSFPALGARMFHDHDGGLAAEVNITTYPAAVLFDGENGAEIVRGPVVGAQAIAALMEELRLEATV
ncbi:MAG TPA: MauE/DoxX family redox-associated membrane protein [Microbacterium sp.]|nr:MauE/DoxX family redox-associated membrane protein [Microbacterium sp.]